MAKQRGSRRLSPALISVIVLLVLGGIFVSSTGVYTDYLWFNQLGFSKVFTTNLWAQFALGLAAGVVTAIVVWVSLWAAFRFRPIYVTQVIGDNANPLAAVRDQLARYSKAVLIGVPVLSGLIAAAAAAPSYKLFLMFLNSTPAGVKDPQFHIDASFYLFQLPFLVQLDSFLSGVALLALVAAVVTQLAFGGLTFVPPLRLSFTRAARIQLGITAGIFVGLEAFSLWLAQYNTMTSASGLYTGATYTDVNATIPGIQIMTGVAILVGLTFLVAAFTGRWRLPVLATALMVISSLILAGIYPWVVQTFQVVPNERTLESEFIKRNIEATRFAYGLDAVKPVNYNAKTTATDGALKQDAETAAQIRIIDPILVAPSFRQLEQYRQYYNFTSKLDVDRYRVGGKEQDTVIAVRELNQAGLGNSQSWFNKVIVYTHGYGVVAAYGNERTVDGQPVFFQSGIPSTGKLGKYRPQIYFGESSPRYSIVGGGNGQKLEMDYPGGKDGSQTTYTTFEGNGGPNIGSTFNRLAYAIKFGDEQILLSNSIDSKSQILYNRDPAKRVKAVAPYLTTDSDPYPAVVNGRVVWIIDGYTTSSHFPYSRSESPNGAILDSEQVSGNFSGDVNYIRNSVKATVDAYDGSVHLYAWDDKDPILKTWQKIYPNTVEPLSKMSASLISHVRYPADLFKIQRNMLGTYHVTEPGAFYSQQDAWMVPNDPSNASTLPQPPYYLSMKTPLIGKSDFSLYSTFIPKATGDASRNVLTGYLVANSNAGSEAGVKGANYGKLQLLVLPRDNVVPGPGQVQNNFNADSDVSKLLNLLRQGSTEVLNGNLLTLPVGGGLLYVQPVYIRSTGETSFPLLKKILVAFGDQIAFEDTLDAALNDLFGGSSGAVAGDGASGGQGNTGGGTSSGTGSPATGNAALNAALQAAKKALSEKAAALQSGDWTAYGKADKALASAITAAINAANKK
jgi:uncharacterized membrane protein (UPF0182 family)